MVDENRACSLCERLWQSMEAEQQEQQRAVLKLSKALVKELRTEIGTIQLGRAWNELSQSERRMLIRGIFASIEALIFVTKQLALVLHPDPKCPTISEAERAFAMDRDFKLTPSGDVEQRAAKISLETNIRFAFKLLAKATEAPTVLDVSGPEWRSLQRAIKVRDRITHPKNISDLTISDEELADVMIGFKWFMASHRKLGDDLRVIHEGKAQTDSGIAGD
jgi:hypothetical protein